MAKRVTPEEIVEMHRLYAKYGNDEDIELDRLIISQNNDGVDTENRIEKFKKYLAN